MLHLSVIALLAAIVLHDGLPPALQPGSLGFAWVAGIVLGLMGAIAIAQHLIVGAAARILDRTGNFRALALAERTLGAARLAAVLVHFAGVLALGWATAARSTIGDLVVIDEIIIIAPALSVVILGWWSFYPIERRLREASLLRSLDDGEPVYPQPTRAAWVFGNIRHQLMLSLGPILLIGVWSEGTERLLAWAANTRMGPRLQAIGLSGADESASPAMLVLKLVGVVGVFAIGPLLLRRVWDTVRLGPGPLRERLDAMCQNAGVKVRDLLVWRTHGSIVNAAVMGIAGPLRYILLTDALIDRLPTRQVEAVMAHEIGHARLGHVPWLVASLLASIGSITAAGIAVLMGIESLAHRMGMPGGMLNLPLYAASIGVQLIGLLGGLLVLGAVSRRFEWQADAYAAKRLSIGTMRVEPPSEDGVQRLTAEAAHAMIGALDSVARLNALPRWRWTWRHGSIADRQRRLAIIVGAPINQLQIDRTARRIKWAVGVGIGLVVAVAAADSLLASRAATTSPDGMIGQRPNSIGLDKLFPGAIQ